MKIYRFGLVLFLLVFSCMTAHAAAFTTLTVCPPGEEDQQVSWFEQRKVYYLLLPSTFDLDSLEVNFDGADCLIINGNSVCSGDVISLPAGENISVVCGKKTYQMQVIQGSSIPSVFITTESGSLSYIEKSKSNEETGTILLIDAQGETVTHQDLSSIKCRGNASFKFTKKSYRIKLEKGADLFGMGKSKTWVLTGNYRDRSHLRNRITYDLAAYAGLAYSPESLSVNLYVNGEYRGLYLLSEKIQIGKNRVNITDLEEETEELNGGNLSDFTMLGSKKAQKKKGKYYDIALNPEDITGGYLVEMRENSSHYKEATSAYYTKHELTADFHSPDYLSEAQYNYISNLLQSFENAIFAEDGIDSDSGKYYTEIADLDSLVRKYMIEEISKNYDGNHSSQYFYKPADSESTLLYAGPVWDYDSAYGIYGKQSTFQTAEKFFINASSSGKSWWTALYKHEDFYQAVLAAWEESFLPGLNILLGEGIDETGRLLSLSQYADEIALSAHMDLIRWPRSKPSSGSSVIDTGSTFEENISFLTQYITARRDWLKTQWSAQEEETKSIVE